MTAEQKPPMTENNTRRLEGGEREVESVEIEIPVPAWVLEAAREERDTARSRGLEGTAMDYVMDRFEYDWDESTAAEIRESAVSEAGQNRDYVQQVR